ncbi:EamA family transporter [bacterium]|nr:EamA family transporter [bacterium]
MNWFTWALLSAGFAGVTAIFAKVGVEKIHSHLATAIRTTVALGFTWLLALPALRDTTLSEIGRRTWLFLTLSGVATGLSWLCYFRALQLGQASQVAPVDKLSVVVAVLLAMLFLGERLNWREGLDVALMVVGAMLVAFK